MEQISLTAESLSFLKTSNSVLEQHKIIDEALRMSMSLHMLAHYGVDLGTEDWTLDLDRGVLEREDSE